MFMDALKIAAKVAVIGLGITAIVGIATYFQFPAINVSLLADAVGRGKAILIYYAGDYLPLFDLGLVLLSVRFVVIPVVRVSITTARVILKLNE